MTDAWRYTAFGEELTHTGTGANPYRFAGERYVGEVGLYQNRARWLDTGRGAFVSVDQLLRQTESPYSYGQHAPTGIIDPTGKLADIGSLSVGVVVAGILASVAIPSHSGFVAAFKECPMVTFYRKWVDFEHEEWGHFWFALGSNESYGWWPKQKTWELTLADSLFGVEGELNGVTNNGGTMERDPHHGDSAARTFHPLLKHGGKYRTCEEMQNGLRTFAKSYRGEWRLIGRSCRNFQYAAMTEVGAVEP